MLAYKARVFHSKALPCFLTSVNVSKTKSVNTQIAYMNGQLRVYRRVPATDPYPMFSITMECPAKYIATVYNELTTLYTDNPLKVIPADGPSISGIVQTFSIAIDAANLAMFTVSVTGIKIGAAGVTPEKLSPGDAVFFETPIVTPALPHLNSVTLSYTNHIVTEMTDQSMLVCENGFLEANVEVSGVYDRSGALDSVGLVLPELSSSLSITLRAGNQSLSLPVYVLEVTRSESAMSMLERYTVRGVTGVK